MTTAVPAGPPPGAEPLPRSPGRPNPSPSQVPVQHLELAVLRRLDGLLQGDHTGLLPGHGIEAGEARPYAPGDDPRRMDWAVTARTGEPHVRDTIADHELELWVVLDTSASLAYGTARSTKAEVAWAAAGALALLASRGGNRVGVVSSGDRRRIIPARSGRAHVGAALAALRAPVDEGTTGDLAGALAGCRRAAVRRGMVVVVSDFLVPDGWDRPLRALASRHDVLAVEVVDPRELELPDVGVVRLADPETRRQREVDTRDPALRQRFADAAQVQRARVAGQLAAAGVDHLVLRTDRDWVADLVRFVAGRKARRLAASGGRR